MFRRPILLLPAVLAAMALPAATALAGEDDDPARLHEERGCVFEDRAKIAVSGDDIDSVAFYVDGDLVRRVTRPAVTERFVFGMSCDRLSIGSHRGRAVVTFEEGSTPARRTLRFQITRAAQGSPRFTG